MSLILLEGFDDGLIDERWVLTGGFDTSSSVFNRIGDVLDFPGPTQNGTIKRNFPAADEHATITIGFWFHLASQTEGDDENLIIMQSDGGTTNHVWLRPTTNGRLRVTVAEGDYYTDIIWAGTGTAHYIELQVVLHDTTGAFTLWIDGNVVLLETNIDTKSGGTKTVFDAIQILTHFTGTSSVGGEMDDIYITNGAGAAPYNGNLGDVVVDTLFPNDNGQYSDFMGSDGNQVDNYLLVDENPHDSDTTYVESSGDTDRESYGLEDLAYATGVIRGVVATAVARNTGAADNLQISTRIAAADYDGATIAAPAGYDAQVRQIWQVSPATAGDWTIAEVNAAEFGVQNVA